MLWKLLWLLIATGIIGYYGWSIHLIMLQKKAWKAFAARYKLEYAEDGLLKPPSMAGTISGYVFQAYTELITNTFISRTGNWTVMEVEFDPAEKGASLIFVSEDLNGELLESGLYKSFKPDAPDWGEQEMMSENPDLFAHLDSGKTESLKRLAALNGSYIFITDDQIGIAAYRTRKPLNNPNEMNAALKVLISIADNWKTPNTGGALTKPAAQTLSFQEEPGEAADRAESAAEKDGHKETVI